MSLSLAQQVATHPVDEEDALLAEIAGDLELDGGVGDLARFWPFWARPEQLAPTGSWSIWLLQTGRRFGKTRAGAEWVLDRCVAGQCKSGALVGRIVADVRAVMIEGESGLVACAERRGLRARYVESHRMVYVELPDGTPLGQLEIFTSIEPDGPRGRGFDTAWCDELAAWPAKVGPSGETCWSNLLLAMSAGDPRVIVTTTPKPTRALIDLNRRPGIRITTGSLYDNADNLARSYVEEIISEYEGTRLAAQEIDGILLLTVEGALWDQDQINADRWDELPVRPRTKILGVDPPTEAGECGIVCAGLVPLARQTGPPRLDVAILADRSVPGRRSTAWAAQVRAVAEELDVDYVVLEDNAGGAMARETLANTGLLIPVRHVKATIGKGLRAEPVALISDRHRLHLVGPMPLLEAQMTGWDPADTSWSPDRLDAMVHAVWPLMRYFRSQTGAQRATGTLPGVRTRPR